MKQQSSVKRVAAEPTDIPSPITRTEPAEVDVTLRPEEVTAELDDGKSFTFMTYNGQIPGPLIRARVGDTVNLTFENPSENAMPHNVDFHAAAGPGGGAEATMTMPGETAHLRFKVTYPGAFIYHCAVPNLDMHISSGMFGMILVEPEEGLPEVDHEFYFGQHDVYTKEADEDGTLAFDFTGMTHELPSYVLFNGGVGAITSDRYGPANVKTGDTARVFFVNGGPNKLSSFHPIGSVWDECWPQGTIGDDPRHHVQTTPVAPGSCSVTTMEFSVPGDFKLVDHALSRVAHKGCLAVIHADGSDNPELFDPKPA